jgi:urease accessory protein
MFKPLADQAQNASASIARAVFILTTLLLPAAALAHPGHGDGGFWPGFLHAFHGIDHVLAAIAVGVWGARLGGRALWAVPLAFVAAMAAGVALAASGTAVPMPEPMIAVSVLLIGALIALDARSRPLLGALLVAAFAPFHAAAHVTEMPHAAGILHFAAGLLISTALLHAIGIAAAHALRARPLALRFAAASATFAGMWMVMMRAF